LPERDEARRRLGLPADAPVVVSVSRLEPRKGVLELVEAFARADAAGAKLVLVGAPNPGGEAYVRQLELRARELGAGLVLAGHCDPAPSLAAADCFALASRSEGFCLAAAEARAAGLPVVATNVGGLPEAVDGDAVLVPADWRAELDEVPVDAFAAALSKEL